MGNLVKFIQIGGFIILSLVCRMQGQPFQTDTLRIKSVGSPPVINGDPSDIVWDSAEWEPLNQVWIPWGGSIDSSDFYGRYKVIWSSQDNLLYVLAEITDDFFVDGYVYHSDPQNNNYPDFDVLEVFIDENASKGKHVFDGTGQTGNDWGYNGENALSYHIMADQPEDGGSVNEIDVCDIAGTSWSDEWIPNYKSHLPEFALSRDENHYYWEYSCKVYNEDYDPSNPSEDTRVNLNDGKIMGLSLAYCDNDESGTERDNFIGSVWVPEARYNDHWMDAQDFRAARLTATAIPNAVELEEVAVPYVIYDPLLRKVRITPGMKSGQVAIFNLQSTCIYNLEFRQGKPDGIMEFSFTNLPDGMYLITTTSWNKRLVSKITVY